MNYPVIPIAVQAASRERKREAPKGRRVDPHALIEVQKLLGNEPRRADLLIEHLHKIQDRFGHLSAAHLAALAQEIKLAQTEVYEVASFYHHFDVVKEGETAPAALTVRVCDSLSCEMAGARELLAKLPLLLGREVRVIAAPCIGRCEQAPAAVVGRNPVPNATVDTVAALVRAGRKTHAPEAFIDLLQYQAGGGYSLLKACIPGARDIASVIKTMEDSSLRGLGGAGGGHRIDLRLSARRIPRLPRDACSGTGQTKSSAADSEHAAHRTASWRWRLHLRRGIRDDRIH